MYAWRCWMCLSFSQPLQYRLCSAVQLLSSRDLPPSFLTNVRHNRKNGLANAIAPHLPRLTDSEVPAERKHQHTFNGFSLTIEAFFDTQRGLVLSLTSSRDSITPCGPCASPSSGAPPSSNPDSKYNYLNTRNPRLHSASPCDTPIA
jgi:hypothetical protein